MAILRKIKSQKKAQKKIFRDAGKLHEDSFLHEENQTPKFEPIKKKKVRGRPKSNPNSRRTKTVSFVITTDEEKKLIRLSKGARLTKSEYMRRLLELAISKKVTL